MSYRVEGTDLVISGFENGISDSIHSGIADMRNVDIMTVPGEASVSLATARITLPAVVNAFSFTASTVGNLITVASTTGWYNGMAIVLNTNTAGGLSTGTVYYVQNLTSTTFTLSLGPAITTQVVVSGNGSGTLTSYQYAVNSPVSYFNDTNGSLFGVNSMMLVDSNAHVWVFFAEDISPMVANTLYFLGNIGGVAASSIKVQSGINVWNGYIFLLGNTTSGTDICNAGNVLSGVAAAWTYTWKILSTNPTLFGNIPNLVSVDFNNFYWSSASGIDSLALVPGKTFNPTDATTYTITTAAVTIKVTDSVTCIAQLGSIILLGGRQSFVYTWNQIDPSFSSLLNVPDNYISKIVATNQNAYVFAGIRGKIYITNGSGMDLFKKVPDYLTGQLNAQFLWIDANYSRNQLYFSFLAYTPSGTVLTSVAGCWCIDLDDNSIRMLNKTSNSTYAGSTYMVCPRPPNSTSPSFGVIGNDIVIGWSDGVQSQIDYSIGTPYSNYESYMHTEMIPVGTFLDPFTPSQIEYKLSAPMVSGEGVRLSYRGTVTDAWTQIGEDLAVGNYSNFYKSNLQKLQWIQFLIELKSTNTNPSYTRLTEIRIRDWPSGKNASPIPMLDF